MSIGPLVVMLELIVKYCRHVERASARAATTPAG